MKHQNITRRMTACVLCAVMVAALLPISAFANGACSYRNPTTGIACGKQSVRQLVSISDVYTASHDYINANGKTAECNYTFCMITEADVCPDGHHSNFFTYRHEHNDHDCQNAG